MDAIKEFVTAHSDPEDPAFPMVQELRRREKELADAKIMTVQFLTPVRNKNGGWGVELSGDPKVIEELAGLIEVAEGLVAETRADILEYARLQHELLGCLSIKYLQAARILSKYNFKKIGQ